MKRRQRPADAAPLSPWADDWVTSRERDHLGDDEANRLAFARRREEALHRPAQALDDELVLDQRPTDEAPLDTTALEVLAWRGAALAGQLLPWQATR